MIDHIPVIMTPPLTSEKWYLYLDGLNIEVRPIQKIVGP